MQDHRFRILTTIITLCFLLMPAVAPAADPPLSTRQREALSPGKANRTVQQDLLSVLKPVKQIRSGMFRMLRGVGLNTRPFGTEYKGVCRMDAVTLRYAPIDEAAEPEEAPVQPYSIEATPFFHIVKLPAADSKEGRGGDLVWQDACNGLNDDDTSWFSATDAFHAVQGALVLEQAVRDVRSGTLKPAPCTDISPAIATCSEAILAIGDVQKIGQVATCAAGPGMLCYAIDLAADTKLTITAKGDPESVVPQGALSISVEQYIIVT
ncbi:MAG: hypothetical protein ABI810_09840 [Sphingomonas bacterium]